MICRSRTCSWIWIVCIINVTACVTPAHLFTKLFVISEMSIAYLMIYYLPILNLTWKFTSMESISSQSFERDSNIFRDAGFTRHTSPSVSPPGGGHTSKMALHVTSSITHMHVHGTMRESGIGYGTCI